MPSPFPGMDPFLEHPAIFPDLHDRFATELSTAINAVLPGKYYAGLASRVWVEESERYVEPDIHLLSTRGPHSEPVDSGGIAIQDEVGSKIKPILIQIPHDEFREPMVEIYTNSGGERLVTHIEVLSLSNKRAGSDGRELYLKKQREILGSEVHLIEIDLLRGGEPTIAIPAESLNRKAGPHDYRICLHRYNRKLDYYAYPISLPECLPEIAIPLLPGDPDVHIDLQGVLATCYRTGRYDVRVRYERDRLAPPLTAAQQAWANEILAKAGFATLA
jgi:hypothetical protein